MLNIQQLKEANTINVNNKDIVNELKIRAMYLIKEKIARLEVKLSEYIC